MKFCVNGLGFAKVCGELSTTRREGWPLCDRHATMWDDWATQHAAAESAGVEGVDFVEFAKAVR